jgi:two-component system LytT family response regulator
LAETVKKLLNKDITEKAENKEQTQALNDNDQVFVKDGDKCWFVKLSDIRLFESEGNYVRVYFDKNRPLILRSLNNLDERLNNKTFFRASRKHIVNLKWVESIENWFNGGLMVKLKGGEQVEISRRQASKLKEMMSL